MKFNLKTALGGFRAEVSVWVKQKNDISALAKSIEGKCIEYKCSILNVKEDLENQGKFPEGAFYIYTLEGYDKDSLDDCVFYIKNLVKKANGGFNTEKSFLMNFVDEDRKDSQWGNATDDGEGFNLPDINAKRVFNFKKYADFGMHENDEGFYDFKRKMWEDARKNPSFGGDVDDAVAYRFDKHVDEVWSAMKKPYFVSIESFGDRANKSDIRTRNFATPEECEAYVEQYKGSVNQSEFYTFDKLLVKIEKYNGSGKGWTKVNEYEINLKEETPQAVPEFSEEQFAV